MKKKRNIFLLVSFLAISILALISYGGQNVSAGYDETITNDGEYTVQNVDEKGGKNYSYPALEKLIASIEDPERKELVTQIVSTPIRVEFSTTNEKSNRSDDSNYMQQMYIDSFNKTVQFIKLPIEELREKAKEVEAQSKKLKEQERDYSNTNS